MTGSPLFSQTLKELTNASRRRSRVDFEDEQDLLTLSVTREMEMTQEIHDLEMELKSLRAAYDHLVAENDKMAAHLANLQSRLRESESERAQLRGELREMKMKDTQSLADYTDLEEENISLQKQLLQMKQAQVEFEALKLEMKRYREETDILNAQLEEMTHLKMVTQRSLGEALDALQVERERVHSLQREMDFRAIQAQQELSCVSSASGASSVFSGGSFGTPKTGRRWSRGVLDSGTCIDEDESGCYSEAQNDLLSEIQCTEQRKFENVLSRVEVEKADLQRQLEEAQGGLQLARREIHLKKEEIEALQSQIDTIMSIEDETSCELAGEANSPEEMGEQARLRQLVRSQEHKYAIALKQISSLQQEVKRCHELEQLTRQFDSEEDLRGELLQLRSRLAQRDAVIHTLESDVTLLNALTKRNNTNVTAVYEDLRGAAHELMRMYCSGTKAAGQKPARYVMEHLSCYKLLLSDDGLPVEAEQAESKDLTDVCRMAEALVYLTKHSSGSVSALLQTRDLKQPSQQQQEAKDAEEIHQQLAHLRSMVLTKREQVATLRNVLRANKKTAEEALANLKTRCEHEKSRASETMTKLRQELKGYREEAATFVSLRALYAQKCDGYVTELDELQRRHQLATDERNTFRSLLSIALAQKGELAKKVEELEKTSGGKVVRRERGLLGCLLIVL